MISIYHIKTIYKLFQDVHANISQDVRVHDYSFDDEQSNITIYIYNGIEI